MDMLESRPIPKRCWVCNSADLKPHCDVSGRPNARPCCGWRTCRACGSISGWARRREAPGRIPWFKTVNRAGVA